MSLKLAGVFSLCFSPMLVAVFVYHAEECLVLHCSGIKEMDFLHCQIAAFRILPFSG